MSRSSNQLQLMFCIRPRPNVGRAWQDW